MTIESAICMLGAVLLLPMCQGLSTWPLWVVCAGLSAGAWFAIEEET